MAKANADKLSPQLCWLADAPLFIDEDQVNRFHDAIVQPESREGTTTIEVSKQVAGKIAAKVGLSSEVEPNALLETISSYFPFLKFKAKAEVQGEAGVDSTKGDSRTVEFHPISSPERKLIHLTLHYLAQLPERVQFVTDLSSTDWRKPDFISESPRALAFIDIPPKTKIIPAAAEFGNGAIDLLYLELEKPVRAKLGDRFFAYPSTDPEASKLKRYWAQFDADYDSTKAMVVIEDASKRHNGGIRWIDYRVKLTDAGDTLHLHVSPGGRYDTGVFAYNFVKRGYKHGVRLVGTLKSEPDMNILAIYDK